MEIFYIWICLVVTWDFLDIFVKTYQTVLLREQHFTLCKLYLNKGKKKKKVTTKRKGGGTEVPESQNLELIQGLWKLFNIKDLHAVGT